MLLPMIYLLGISLKPAERIFSEVLLPFTLENYLNVLSTVPIGSYLINSMLFSLGVAFGQIALAVSAAYAFSYYKFPLKNLLLGLVILSLLVPFVVTYVPNYLLLAQWCMVNTLHGMTLPMLGISLGFGIFLLRQHFLGFQREIIEAAMIDGANSLQTLL